MYKSNKAITLIALIITIIVLLILAAVTINMALGDNGLFNKSKSSVAKYENAQEKDQEEILKTGNTIDKYLVSSTRNDTQYDIIFEYNASIANKKADEAGTYALNLGNGKTSVNDYKYLIVFSQTNLFDTETSNIVYNFPDEPITKNLFNNTQYCNSVYYSASYQYLVRYCFTDTSLIIRNINKTGWEGAMIKKIIGVY